MQLHITSIWLSNSTSECFIFHSGNINILQKKTFIFVHILSTAFFIQQEVAWKKKSVIEKYSNFNLAKTRRRDKRFVKCVTEVNKSPIQSNQKNTKISGFPLLVATGTYLLMIVMAGFEIFYRIKKCTYWYTFRYVPVICYNSTWACLMYTRKIFI